MSTNPSRSERGGEKNESEKNAAQRREEERRQLTFAALESDEVTSVVERLYYNFYKVELPLRGGKED